MKNDKRQKNQLRLAFPEEDRSEAPTASGEGAESFAAKRLPESPALAIALPNAYFDSLGIPRLTVAR